MKFIKYSKYAAEPFDGLSAEDLMQMLQEFLLQSGFENQYSNFYEMDPEQNMEQLHQALLNAMNDQGMIPPDLLKQLMENAANYENSKLRELLDKLLQRLSEEGYITIDNPPAQGTQTQAGPGHASGPEAQVKFEL